MSCFQHFDLYKAKINPNNFIRNYNPFQCKNLATDAVVYTWRIFGAAVKHWADFGQMLAKDTKLNHMYQELFHKNYKPKIITAVLRRKTS